MEVGNVFRKYHLENGESEEIVFGDLAILIKRLGQGWIIHSFKKDEEETEGGDFYLTGVSNDLYLEPALQTKPLVFKGNGLSVLPEAEFNFFLKIPLVFQFYHTKKTAKNLIVEISSLRLSDTWFGEPQSGESAYAMGSKYFLDLDDLQTEYFEAICPISMKNNSDKTLELQRLIIRVENLILYQVNNRIFTSLVKLEYKGKETMSSAHYVASKAIHGDKPRVISKARNTDNASMKVNFNFISNIYKSM